MNYGRVFNEVHGTFLACITILAVINVPPLIAMICVNDGVKDMVGVDNKYAAGYIFGWLISFVLYALIFGGMVFSEYIKPPER